MRRRRRRRRRNSLLCYHDGDDDEEECTHIEIDDLPLIYVRWLAVHILSHFMCNVMAVVVFVPVSSSLTVFWPFSLLSLFLKHVAHKSVKKFYRGREIKRRRDEGPLKLRVLGGCGW